MGNHPLAEAIRPHVEALKRGGEAGDEAAMTVVALYELARVTSGDPAVVLVCEAALRDWLAAQPDKEQRHDH